MKGIMPAEAAKPEFSVLLGAQGAGKSTLAGSLKNTVVISPDDVIKDYYQACGYDLRENNYTPEIGDFAMKTSFSVLDEAVAKRCNIAYDAMSMNDLGNIFGSVKKFGYGFNIKAVLNDEYTSAMNVEERKLKNNADFAAFKQGRATYPGSNPLEVDSQVSILSSMKLIDFLMKADEKKIKFEVYEPNRDEPSYVSGGRESFCDYLDTVQLPNQESQLKRCDKLIKKAQYKGNEDAFLRLKYLKREMMGK